MARIVRKYGGSSLREPEQIRAVARHIAALRMQGNEIVVVVSAMAATTDEFIALARALHHDPPRREMDMLLSVGERISCSLLSMALDAEGVNAVSYTGSQVGIITDSEHGEAHIVDVKPDRLLAALDKGQVVVVAGFQGVSVDKEITTLGRGGSDATAIALAAAIGAERCELMKDVEGVFSADPDVVRDPVLVSELDYESALRMARGGSSVLQSEAARLAREQRVPLRIGRTVTDRVGTIITDRPLACPAVVGIARRDGLRQVRGRGDPPDEHDWEKLVRGDEGWVAWGFNPGGGDAEFSGLTVVQSRERVPGLHRCVMDTLLRAEIPVAGVVGGGAELWVCVPAADADGAVRLLHDAFAGHGWLRPRADGDTIEHERAR
ncbi:MAG: Aspartokinase [Calditrichaeota bacterium]|nr:Aspartokinase [Calditrichota bacterium]